MRPRGLSFPVLAWNFVVMVLMVPKSSIHAAKTTTRSAMVKSCRAGPCFGSQLLRLSRLFQRLNLLCSSFANFEKLKIARFTWRQLALAGTPPVSVQTVMRPCTTYITNGTGVIGMQSLLGACCHANHHAPLSCTPDTTHAAGPVKDTRTLLNK